MDGDLWQSVDGYAASASDTTLTITTAGDGPHLLDIRNRPEKNLQSSGYKIRFESLATPSSAYQYDLQTTTYTYDGLARLLTTNVYPGLNTSATPSRAYTYAFDVAGNRTQQVVNTGSPVTTNYTYNAANQLTSDGTHSYTYDAAGRMTSDGVNAYAWDRANRLLSYNNTAFQFAYDGDGRRVQQTVGGTATQYVLDTLGLEKVLQATTGANTTGYVHGPMGIAQQQNPNASWNWMVSDGLGSVRDLVDANLNPLESQFFDPFGSVITNTGGNQSNFGFTGEWMDGTTLIDLRARYYNPTLGVFPNLDPLEGTMRLPMSLNRYMYVQGNVVNRADPSGLDSGIACEASSLNSVLPGFCPIVKQLEIASDYCRGNPTASTCTSEISDLLKELGDQASAAASAGDIVGEANIDAMMLAINVSGAYGLDTAVSIARGLIQATSPAAPVGVQGASNLCSGLGMGPGCTVPTAPGVAVPPLPSVNMPDLRQLGELLGNICTDELLQILKRILGVLNLATEMANAKTGNRLNLYHYTFAENIPSIIATGVRPSLSANGDAQWGDGQYFTDLTPQESATVTRYQHSAALFVVPWYWGGRPPLKDVGWILFNIDERFVVRVAPLFGRRFPNRSIFLYPNTGVLSVGGIAVANGIVTFSLSRSGYR